MYSHFVEPAHIFHFVRMNLRSGARTRGTGCPASPTFPLTARYGTGSVRFHQRWNNDGISALPDKS